jgi:type I protein arginine methyltransferase
MLDTVIYARDKWLIPNGIIFPDKAVMYLSAVEDANVKRDRIDFWVRAHIKWLLHHCSQMNKPNNL